MSYLASKNDILTFYPCILSLYRILERKYTIMAQNPVITITMDNGDVIKAELYPEIAPVSVNNFISLVKKGFYDDLTFHRVIEGFMIQGGCPLGNGTGGPGYTIRGEFAQNGFNNPLKHEAGVLSMARAMHPDSAGSQFFIMHKAAPHLDGAYAAFGKVTDGLDVVNKIAETDTDWNDAPLDPQVIRTITVDTFGVDYPEPEKC
jgi:peptidyl-prolyl cis-trans isomerase B (cyclophilin B)